jgi:2-keto-4-pentenoate hydratase/2-oxohepta-3-ene-1,7-dioic acid hydratase in catechol pathway
MKWVRFEAQGHARWGSVVGDTITEVSGSIFGWHRQTAKRHALDAVRILPPARPSKIIGIGLNYRDHALETGQTLPTEPLFFLKAPSAMIGPGEPIVLPFPDHEVHHESELAFVIGRLAKDVAQEQALDHILGYTCGNDVSDRTVQRPRRANSMAKSADTFAPLGPYLVTDVDPGNLGVECLVNGELRQSSNTRELVFNVQALVSYLSRTMTLLPGDVVMTGTPAGVGTIRPGDVVEVRIERLGTLRNPVRSS